MTTTMAVGAELKLQTQIQIALQYVSTHQPSQPGIIVQAQDALLHWEHDMPDAYVVALMSLVGSAHADLGGSNTASAAATLRLAAILSLKAAIVRRWKDRGRGSVQTNLLSENVKIFIRQSMLKVILSGKVDGQLTTNLALNPNEITNQQMELIQDRSLQMNAAALLSKIARMDLPLKFHDLIPSLIEGMKFSRQSICQLQQGHSQYNQHHMTMYRSILYNSMNCLENVLTELSTQRLLVDKKFRNSVAIEYLGTVVESGLIPSIQDLESLFNENESMIGIIEALQFATVSSRTVFHMMIGSFPKLLAGQSLLVDQLLELIHSLLSRWHSLFPGGGTTRYASCCEAVGELLHAHCGFIVTLQNAYPTEFVRYLIPFLSLFHRSLMCSVGNEKAVNLTDEHVSSNTNIPLSDPRLIAFLNFMINAVGATHSDLDAATKEMTSFFTPLLVISLARTLLELMTCHMHPYDDENKKCAMINRVQWQDEPEEFYHYEMQRSSDNDVGSASQNLLLSLVESPLSGQYLIPWLMELIAKLASQRLAAEIEGGISTGIDLQVILSALPLGPPSIRCGNEVLGPEICLIFQWDAIFTAVGLAGYTFQRHGFDFRSWCETSLCPLLMVLVQETSHQVCGVIDFIEASIVSIPSLSYIFLMQTYLPILRRRIIWLMSCNAHQVPISSYMIGMLTSVLTSGSVQNDLCVRLTTVQALDSLLPQCESDTSVLHSIVQPLATALYQLTNECDEIESRSSCLDLLANLITYVGVNGATLSNEVLDTIVTPLPSIWENATGQNLIFRRSILNILSCIASLLSSAQRAVLHPIALRMIDDCIAKEETMFLVNEALKSWWLFLRLSPTYDELLSTLFFHAADISKDFDHIM